LRVANDLLIQVRQSGTNFEAVVRANTEDEGAVATGGLMENIERGQTVEPFETAAFALRIEGEFAEPVLSRFGVHIIQLLEHQDQRQQAFDEVQAGIIEELKLVRGGEYRQAIHAEARDRYPAGFIEHTEALDALMLQTSDGKLGLGEQIPLE